MFKKVVEDLSSPVVGFGADFGLLIDFEEPGADRPAFDHDRAGVVAKQRTAGSAHLGGGKFCAPAACKVFTGDPLGHEAGFPGSDVLIRDQSVADARSRDDLVEQHVGMIDPATSRKRPVRTDAFRGHAFGLDNAGVGMAARSHQPPKPSERGRQDVEHSDDPVGRVLGGARRSADADAADIDIDGSFNHGRNNVAGNNHAGIRTRVAG